MSVAQVSVFVESRQGHLKRILDSFQLAGVNVRGYCASDTVDYGIVRFILDDPERALTVLKDSGRAATTAEVICLQLVDAPGELARVVGIISEQANITYSYSLVGTFVIFHVDDLPAIEAALTAAGIQLATLADLAQSF